MKQKQLFDYLAAIFLFFLFLPLFVSVCVALYVSGMKSIFFTQIRPGKQERLFKIIKFKTMSNAKDEIGYLLPDDLRMTRMGSFIRKLSLDELPQLLNVINGDMSFVGPRPLLPEYLPLYNQAQARRHDLKPGITGWAQVNGRNAISWEKKFELDVWYVDNQSFLLDMKILWMTFLNVVRRDGISSGTSATMEKFKGTKC